MSSSSSSMSQPQSQQSQPQPVVVYPQTIPRQQPNHSHTNGSFGTVFIVLGVIVAISAVACFLGRFCNRKFHNQRPKMSHKQAQPKNLNFPDHPKEGDIENQNPNPNQNRIQPESQNFRIRPREEDVEYGFDNKMRNPKEGGGGGGVDYGFENKMRNPKEVGGVGGGEYGFENKMRNPKEGGGGEFGFDKRFPSGRSQGGNGGSRGFMPYENGVVNKFGRGEEPKFRAYDAE